MMLARQAATLAKGRSRAAMVAAGEAAADGLAAMVQPFAGALFEKHRAAGRPVVLATTTPYDLVKPLADRLGLDDVIATRYGVDADGTYDGSLVGPFVWAAGKLEAVRAWAAEHDVDLGESFAYSDSFYDAPLLVAVGTPWSSTPTRGWCCWRRHGAGRSSTSTCRPAWSRSPCSASSCSGSRCSSRGRR